MDVHGCSVILGGPGGGGGLSWAIAGRSREGSGEGMGGEEGRRVNMLFLLETRCRTSF